MQGFEFQLEAFNKPCELKDIRFIFFFVLKVLDDFSVFKKFEDSITIFHMKTEIYFWSITRKFDEVIEIMVHHVEGSFEGCEFFDFDIRA